MSLEVIFELFRVLAVACFVVQPITVRLQGDALQDPNVADQGFPVGVVVTHCCLYNRE